MEFSITNESCRVCLRKTPTGKHLSEPAKGKEHVDKRTLLDLYHMCTGLTDPPWLQSQTNTFYPRKICNACEQLLLAAYELRKQSSKSERVLRNILQFYDDDEACSVRDETTGADHPHEDCEEHLGDGEDCLLNQEAEGGEAEHPGLESLHEAGSLIGEESRTNLLIIEASCDRRVLVEEEHYEKHTETDMAGTAAHDCYESTNPQDNTFIKEEYHDETVSEEYIVQATVDAYDTEPNDDIESMMDDDEEEDTNGAEELSESKGLSPPNHTHCPDCGKLVTVRYLAKHRDTHLDTQRYECDTCSMRFTFLENLTKHKRIHENDKRYKCPYCEELFLHWASRRYHIARVHTKEKRFACEYCGARFRQSSHYQIHLRRHTGSTPYACSECSRTFITKYSLNEHMFSHSDKKEFSCTHCWKHYKTVKSLRVHLKTHSDAKEYICSVCKKTFTQNHSLRTHHMKAHPEFELPPPGTLANIKAISRLSNDDEPQEMV